MSSVFLVISRDVYNELHNLYDAEMKAKKKFLIDIFKDHINIYDQNSLNYQIYNFKVTLCGILGSVPTAGTNTLP